MMGGEEGGEKGKGVCVFFFGLLTLFFFLLFLFLVLGFPSLSHLIGSGLVCVGMEEVSGVVRMAVLLPTLLCTFGWVRVMFDCVDGRWMVEIEEGRGCEVKTSATSGDYSCFLHHEDGLERAGLARGCRSSARPSLAQDSDRHRCFHSLDNLLKTGGRSTSLLPSTLFPLLLTMPPHHHSHHHVPLPPPRDAQTQRPID